ncbi:NPCBM/NEW2 domain-containing protein, partial [bacterium]|nr:NPCBM/NEW2 domain-containing protein [bacterium]
MRKLALSLAACALATAGAARRAGAEEIRAISDRYDEQIVSIGPQGGRTVLKTEKREIPLELVKQIRFDEGTHGEPTGPKVILLNKDEIRGSIAAGDKDSKDSFRLKTTTMGDLEANLDKVAAIFLDVPPENERKLTSKHLAWLNAADFAGRPTQDTVYLKAGGKTGGIVESVSSKGITLDAGKPLGVLTFPLKDVEILVLGNTGEKKLAGPKGTAVRVRCGDGSTVSGGIIKYADGKLVLEHPLGSASSPVTIAQKDLLDLFVLNGAFVYVSDLEPTKVDQKFPDGMEYNESLYGWKRDRENFEGGRLRLGGRTYEKGLGVHSYCSLTFPLGGAYKEFRAV